MNVFCKLWNALQVYYYIFCCFVSKWEQALLQLKTKAPFGSTHFRPLHLWTSTLQVQNLIWSLYHKCLLGLDLAAVMALSDWHTNQSTKPLVYIRELWPISRASPFPESNTHKTKRHWKDILSMDSEQTEVNCLEIFLTQC